MAKMKTNRSAAKRFKKTKSGRFKRSKAGRGHLTGKKSPKRIRQLRKPTLVHKSDEKRVNDLLPYS